MRPKIWSMTKTNTLGVVGSVPIPEVVRNINSFTMGAQSVNPNVKTKVVWVNKWFDPPKEGEAAQSLINQGADVLMQNTDSSAVLQTAEKHFGDKIQTSYVENVPEAADAERVFRDMVLIESGSTDAAGLAKMAGYVEARLQALGARTELIAPARGPGSMVKGSFSGTGTRKIMRRLPHTQSNPRGLNWSTRSIGASIDAGTSIADARAT